MALIVSDLEADLGGQGVQTELIERLPIDLDYLGCESHAVTNDARGEDGDPRTYIVQRILVSTDPELSAMEALHEAPDQVEEVRQCTCKGFKFHYTPSVIELDQEPGDTLRSIGECKHVEAVRKAQRSEETRDADQGALDGWA